MARVAKEIWGMKAGHESRLGTCGSPRGLDQMNVDMSNIAGAAIRPVQH